MERTEVLDMMGELKLYGMRNAYNEASEETTNTQRFEADSLAEEPGFEPRLTESESATSRKYRGSKERVARFQVHGLDPPISVEPHPLGPPHRPRPARRNECERARL